VVSRLSSTTSAGEGFAGDGVHLCGLGRRDGGFVEVDRFVHLSPVVVRSLPSARGRRGCADEREDSLSKDGSWASSGGVRSILISLTGVFSAERATAIREALGA